MVWSGRKAVAGHSPCVRDERCSTISGGTPLDYLTPTTIECGPLRCARRTSARPAFGGADVERRAAFRPREPASEHPRGRKAVAVMARAYAARDAGLE